MNTEDFCYWLMGVLATTSNSKNHYPDLSGEVVEAIDHQLARTLHKLQKERELDNDINIVNRLEEPRIKC